MIIGVDSDFDYLYDPQRTCPAGWCPNCGKEIYAEGHNLCPRCEAAELQDSEPQETENE